MFVNVRFPLSLLDICLWVINNSPSDLVLFLMPIYELVLPMEAIMWEQIRRSNPQFHRDETYIWIEGGDANEHHHFARMSYDEETQSLHVESSFGPIHKREREGLYGFHFTSTPDIEAFINICRFVIFKESGEFRMVLFPLASPDIVIEAYKKNFSEDDTSEEEPYEVESSEVEPSEEEEDA